MSPAFGAAAAGAAAAASDGDEAAGCAAVVLVSWAIAGAASAKAEIERMVARVFFTINSPVVVRKCVNTKLNALW